MHERGKKAGRRDAERPDWSNQLEAQILIAADTTRWQGGLEARPWLVEYTQGYVIGMAERLGELAAERESVQS